MLNIIGVITSRYNYWKLHHLRLRLRCATTSTPSRSEWRQLEDPQRDMSLSKSTKRRLYVSSSRFANRKCSSMISVMLKHLDLKFQKSTKLEWRWQVEKEASPAIATQLTWIAPLHTTKKKAFYIDSNGLSTSVTTRGGNTVSLNTNIDWKTVFEGRPFYIGCVAQPM